MRFIITLLICLLANFQVKAQDINDYYDLAIEGRILPDGFSVTQEVVKEYFKTLVAVYFDTAYQKIRWYNSKFFYVRINTVFL
jgi:hypothetical protein